MADDKTASAVCFAEPGRVGLTAVPPLVVTQGHVRLRTLYSGISSGTELTTYLGTNPFLHRRWDGERRLFIEGTASSPYPVVGAGYEEVGEVIEIAHPDPDRESPDVPEVTVGDTVWGIWGHRSDGVLPIDVAAQQVMPPGTDPVLGVFARVGAVALNAVIEADIHVGETVAVFGQGVIGLLMTALARLNGAEVVGVDTRADRLALSGRFGATHVVDTVGRSAAEEVRDLTGGRGADVCLEVSGAYPALQEAMRTVGYGGRVVAAGFYQGDGEALRLGEEFHHNRVEIVCSQISGPPPRYAPRWTRDRLHRDFMRLVVNGRIDPRPLISRVVPATAVAAAFDALADRTADVMQVVLDFGAMS
jgi:2-desacetyl-2-hydroxyethyl bacteriochlorophyllide A dehydrogenase